MNRDPLLGRMFLASSIAHLALFLILAVSGLLRSRAVPSAIPYVVDLLPAVSSSAPSSASVPNVPRAVKPPMPSVKPSPTVPARHKEPPSVTKKPEKAPEPSSNRKAGIEPASAKTSASVKNAPSTKPVEQEIERMSRVKQMERLASLRSAATTGTAAATSTAGVSRSGPGGASPEQLAVYYGLIRYRVMASWFYTGPEKNALVAEALITIGKNGGVLGQKIVKGSGNQEFDRSVLRAIAKASPFPPPPEGVDTEIQFKFSPGEDSH